MPLPKTNHWYVFWTSGEQLVIRKEKVPAKSPKVALRKFTAMYPNRTVRGMSMMGGMPMVDVPESSPTMVRPTRTLPPRHISTPARAIPRPGLGAADLIDHLQDDLPNDSSRPTAN